MYCALRFVITLQEAFPEYRQINMKFMMFVIRKSISFMFTMMRTRSTLASEPIESELVVTKDQVTWYYVLIRLGLWAFKTVLQKKHLKYSILLKQLYRSLNTQDMKHLQEELIGYTSCSLNYYLLNTQI